MKEYGFGADLGGTTCKLGLFKTDGTLLEKWEIPTDTSDDGANILKDIAAAVHSKMVEKSLTKEMVCRGRLERTAWSTGRSIWAGA